MQLVPPPEWLTSEAEIESAVYYFSQAENGIAIDTETTGTDTKTDLPIIASMSDGRRRVGFLLETARLDCFRNLLLDRRIPKIGTNIKFDLHMLANAGFAVDGRLEDTLVMDWLNDENRQNLHGLKETARDYLSLRMLDFNEVFPKKVPGFKGVAPTGERIWYALRDPATFPSVLEYATKDAYASYKVRDYLAEKLRNQLINESTGYSLLDLFQNIEAPFTQTLFNMERRGFTVCTGYLRSIAPMMDETLANIEREIADKAGWPVNLNSPKQVGKLLFDQLKRKPVKKSATGAFSTDNDVLEKLAAGGCEFSKLMLTHRKVAKIKGTYVDGLIREVDQFLRIHTTLNQYIVVTGRLSSKGPNLQNIPASGKDKFHIRDAFVAAPGKVLVIADYDQLEMKIMAHFAQDEAMIRDIIAGKDLHSRTAALIKNVPYENFIKAKKKDEKDLTEEDHELLNFRSGAKAINFGLLYGMGAARLAEELGIKPDDAQRMLDDYFRAIPSVKTFIEDTHRDCEAVGFVTTILGRRRRLPQINATAGGRWNKELLRAVAEAKRMDVNSRIQGTAADLARGAMIRCENDPELKRIGAIMLLQIHDELIFEVDDDPELIRITKERMKALMEEPFPGFKLRVPLTVSCNHGYSWTEAK